MKQKAEEIYHRFVNYEWNDVGDGLQKSILEAIETALKEGRKLPIHGVVRSGNVDSINAEFPKAIKEFAKACNNYLNSKDYKAMIESFKKVGAID